MLGERKGMIGGKVIETIELEDRVWINTQEKNSSSTCAIYVKKDAKSRAVSEGDTVWWQGAWALWTPAFIANQPNCDHRHHVSCKRAGKDYDIQLKRIGFSGVGRPTAI